MAVLGKVEYNALLQVFYISRLLIINQLQSKEMTEVP